MMPIKITSLYFTILCITALLLTACGSAATPVATLAPTPTQFVPPSTEPSQATGTAPANSANALAGSQWQLTAINGSTLVNASSQPKPITLNFGTDSQVSGWGGCNSYGGGYQVQNDTLTFDSLIHTEMACTDAAVMQQENQYFQTLQSASKFNLAPEQLTIIGQGQDTLVFTSASIP